jgi:adenylate kinase family enzyme
MSASQILSCFQILHFSLGFQLAAAEVSSSHTREHLKESLSEGKNAFVPQEATVILENLINGKSRSLPMEGMALQILREILNQKTYNEPHRKRF